MPRKGENIYKRKDGRWEGRYIGCYDENHKAKYVYIYGKTYTEVKQKLAIERGRQKQHVPAEKKQITYGEVLDLWLHSTKTSIKESTYARYAHLINSHIKPQLGDYKLSMLSTEIIENFIENQLVEGQLDRTGGLAPKTVIDLLAIVKSTIGYSRAYHYSAGRLVQITKDNTEGQRMLALGLLTRKELSNFPARKDSKRQF